MSIARSHRFSLWFLLALIPVIAMGWSIGQYGPVSDDWMMLYRAQTNTFINVDETRPLAFMTPGISYHLAGGSIPGMYFQIVVLHIIEIVLFFEVLRVIFSRWQNDNAPFLAFAAAAMYALYPSDVSRHTIMMIHGRYMHIAAFIVTLLWIRLIQQRRFMLIIPALILVLLSLLTKESLFFIYLLLPLMLLLYYDEKPWAVRWYGILGLWYGVIGVWSVWRFVIIPHTGDRSPHVPGLAGLIREMAESFYNMTVNTALSTGREYADAVNSGTLPPWLLVALFAAVLLIFIAGARLTGWQPQRSKRGWMLVASGLVLWAAGTLPYIMRGTGALAITSIQSRDTQAAVIGLVLVLTVLLWQNRTLLLVAAVLVTSAGMLRQVQTGSDYVTAWSIQRAYWQRMLEMPLDILYAPNTGQPRQMLILSDFPRYYGHALMATDSWGFRGAVMFMTPASIYIWDRLDLRDLSAADGALSMVVDRRNVTQTRQLEDVRLMTYDAVTGEVRLQTEIPQSMLAPGAEAIPLYTGINSLIEALPLPTVLGEYVPSPVCKTEMRVVSDDSAPETGDVILRDEAMIIDRRRVQAGEPLHYNLLAPCGAALSAFYQPESGGEFLLPSQAGDYNTAAEGESAPYITLFSARR